MFFKKHICLYSAIWLDKLQSSLKKHGRDICYVILHGLSEANPLTSCKEPEELNAMKNILFLLIFAIKQCNWNLAKNLVMTSDCSFITLMCESHQVLWIYVQLIQKLSNLILIHQVWIFLSSDFHLQERNRISGAQLSIKTKAKEGTSVFPESFVTRIFPHSAATLHFPRSSFCCWYLCRSLWFCPARLCQTNLQTGFGLFHISGAGFFLCTLPRSPGHAPISFLLPSNVWVLSEASY